MPKTLTLPGLTVVRDWRTPVLFRADTAPTDDDEEPDGDEGPDMVDPADEDEDDDAAPSIDNNLGVMEVHFSQFNAWYRIDSWWEGSFMERTAPGSFKRTIDAHNSAANAGQRVKTLFNHGMDFNIGDKILGPIDSLSERDDGPVSVVPLFDTSYNRDLAPGIRAGVYGSSFMFRVIQEEWNEEPDRSDYNPDGIPERTIKEVRLFEAGPVTFPASPSASANMRCLSGTDRYYEHIARIAPDKVRSMRSELVALRGGGPAIGTPRPDGLADGRLTDSARSHSGGLTHAQRRERLYPYLRGAAR